MSAQLEDGYTQLHQPSPDERDFPVTFSRVAALSLEKLMATETLPDAAVPERCSDEEIVARVRAGDTALYEIIMRRYQRRLYRTALAIVRDAAEAENVMQDVYVRAHQHLDQFAERAPSSAWLTRIAVHEALARLRQRDRYVPLKENDHEGELVMT